MGLFKDVKYYSVIKELIKKDFLILIRNLLGFLGIFFLIENFYLFYYLIIYN